MGNKLSLIVRRLELAGLRVTSQRRTLLQIFSEADGFLQSRELYERMARVYPGVSYDTIYRNVRLMRDAGIVEQFDFDDGFKYKLSCVDHHHHHLICLGCDAILPLPFCPMTAFEAPSSFIIVRHKFEVYGYCQHCAGRQGQGEENANS
ncbi:transcriptional repressor [Paenibacillus sambharensis]|uniref:Transcriptional repressor n=1 Tax=Paenibacillus sambharensis TaxID=1803190 RepID=A0A2W1L7V6_9BACL|nr:Fur family transcriptional regulator [Paenibacillus sambharensis]PZD95043.1 transcriptional repressor [Paenibacillus sambharensis]